MGSLLHRLSQGLNDRGCRLGSHLGRLLRSRCTGSGFRGNRLSELLNRLLNHSGRLLVGGVDSRLGGLGGDALRLRDGHADRPLRTRTEHRSARDRQLNAPAGRWSKSNRPNHRSDPADPSAETSPTNTGNAARRFDAVARGAGKFPNNIGDHIPTLYVQTRANRRPGLAVTLEGELGEFDRAVGLDAKGVAVHTQVEVHKGIRAGGNGVTRDQLLACR